MLELVLCSLFTIVPDYLYRRYVQDKRIGREITLYSVWFELRWGIVGCLMPGTIIVWARVSWVRSQDTRRSYAPVLTSRASPQTRTLYGSATPGAVT